MKKDVIQVSEFFYAEVAALCEQNLKNGIHAAADCPAPISVISLVLENRSIESSLELEEN